MRYIAGLLLSGWLLASSGAVSSGRRPSGRWVDRDRCEQQGEFVVDEFVEGEPGAQVPVFEGPTVGGEQHVVGDQSGVDVAEYAGGDAAPVDGAEGFGGFEFEGHDLVEAFGGEGLAFAVGEVDGCAFGVDDQAAGAEGGGQAVD